MNEALLEASRLALQAKSDLPFSVYQSWRAQHLLNVPVYKPTLIIVLSGCKELPASRAQVVQANQFVVLANHCQWEMRNIPANDQYYAILIEFDEEDFDGLVSALPVASIQGNVSDLLSKSVEQFCSWSVCAPRSLWSARRKEILLVLQAMGYSNLYGLLAPQSMRQRVQRIIQQTLDGEHTAYNIAQKLALSESSLRRHLRYESTNLQQLKDEVRLGAALHTLQTSFMPIGLIAQSVGYQSQSRFTQKFKQQFGLTPSELRRTRELTALGE